jgi:hypothetical protein
MLTRFRGRAHSYWIILQVVSDSPGQRGQKYHLQYINCSLLLVEPIEYYYPFHSCHKLPAVMNDALEAISGKCISCSFCSESLLEAIGAMAEHSSYSELSEKFNSSDEFVDHCMEMLACKYIFRAAKVLQHCNSRAALSKEIYLEMFRQCK